MNREKLWLAGIITLVFVSRIPFLLPGFGAEEDAWGLFVTARKVSLTGIYEVSRLPGHPFQELVYFLLWPQGAVAFNLITAAFSATAVGFFIASVKKLGIQNHFIAGMIFAFIPVVYINSCNAMDYLWAMAFVMASFYFLLDKKFILSGILIGLAAGCRITSLAMLVPFAIWIYDTSNWKNSVSHFMKCAFAALAVSAIVFFPVYSRYGIYFFDYVAQIPVPASKAIYKATIGVWGVIGFFDFVTVLLLIFFRSKIIRQEEAENPAVSFSKLKRMCWSVILIYLMAYISLPQKAAFFIPMLPFIIILLSMHLKKTSLVAFSFSMIFSTFFIGLNLDDPLRGSEGSAWSFSFKTEGQNVTLDLLKGPLIAEQQKRKSKMEFSQNVLEKIKRLKNSTVIISGFWMNDILGKTDYLPSHVKLVYYVPEDSLLKYKNEGTQIFYLPEQNNFNDQAFGKKITDKYALPF